MVKEMIKKVLPQVQIVNKATRLRLKKLANSKRTFMPDMAETAIREFCERQEKQ